MLFRLRFPPKSNHKPWIKPPLICQNRRYIHVLCKGFPSRDYKLTVYSWIFLRWVGISLQLNETLAYMAYLVRENPNITVREIADRLKFADNKSVYYWLGKANFQGIGDFKQAILKDQAETLEGLGVIQNGETKFLIKIPVKQWNPKKTDNTHNWVYLFYDTPNPRGLFAVTVESNDFAPWYLKGDMIIVNSEAEPSQAGWVLLKKGRSHFIARCDDQKNLIDINSLELLCRKDFDIIGGIIQQWRNYPQS